MSSTVAAEPQNKQGSSRARRIAMGVLLAVFILAAAGFAYGVVSYGGITGVEKALFGTAVTGSRPSDSYPPPSSASNNSSASVTASGSAAQTPTVTSGDASSSLPAAARSAMYDNQLESQDAINHLLAGQLKAMQFRAGSGDASSALVPTTVVYRSGAKGTATMLYRNYNGLWFFEGFSPTHPLPNSSVDEKVVSIITAQQALPESQDAANALLTGGIKGLRITGVTKGAGTATVSAVVTGSGAYSGKQCRFVFLRKPSGVDTFWFLTRFSWQ